MSMLNNQMVFNSSHFFGPRMLLSHTNLTGNTENGSRKLFDNFRHGFLSTKTCIFQDIQTFQMAQNNFSCFPWLETVTKFSGFPCSSAQWTVKSALQVSNASTFLVKLLGHYSFCNLCEENPFPQMEQRIGVKPSYMGQQYHKPAPTFCRYW